MDDAQIVRAYYPAGVLVTLTSLARKYGWTGDYHEVSEFVCWCHRDLGFPEPSATDLEPYPVE